MCTAPKSLDCAIRYRFASGEAETFRGRKCYRLSNSWHHAIGRAMRACTARGESFDMARVESGGAR